MKIVIIEDGPSIAAKMKKYIEEYSSAFKVVKILSGVDESLEYFENSDKPDLIFSDIELNDGLCFEIFEKTTIKCPVIFTTSYNEYWQRAFKLNSIDYLLKPVTKEKIFQSIELFQKIKEYYDVDNTNSKLMELIKSVNDNEKPAYKERYLLKKGDKYNLVNVSDLMYVYSSEKLSYLVDKEGVKYFSYDSLSKIEGELKPELFFRINRKYIVNINYIKKVKPFFKGKLIIIMSDSDEELVVSQAKANSFRNWLSF